MTIISFASSKGGAGKTTACIVLGTEFAAQGSTVSMIDADPAQRLAAWANRGIIPKNMRVMTCTDVRNLDEHIKDELGHSDVILVDLEGIASRFNSAVIARSNLVIIPMGDEQQDATAAIDTIREIKVDEATLGRSIPYRVIFTRTKAAVKSNIAKMINKEMRESLDCFTIELCDRSAYSNLHNTGGGLRDLPDRVGGLEKAIANAMSFAAETFAILSSKSEREVIT